MNYRYRKWSDGFLEQWFRFGGSTSGTITFPRAYSGEGTYNIQVTGMYSNDSRNTVSVADQTGTSFKYWNTYSNDLQVYLSGY